MGKSVATGLLSPTGHSSYLLLACPSLVSLKTSNSDSELHQFGFSPTLPCQKNSWAAFTLGFCKPPCLTKHLPLSLMSSLKNPQDSIHSPHSLHSGDQMKGQSLQDWCHSPPIWPSSSVWQHLCYLIPPVFVLSWPLYSILLLISQTWRGSMFKRDSKNHRQLWRSPNTFT